MNQRTSKELAYHEAGHVIVGEQCELGCKEAWINHLSNRGNTSWLYARSNFKGLVLALAGYLAECALKGDKACPPPWPESEWHTSSDYNFAESCKSSCWPKIERRRKSRTGRSFDAARIKRAKKHLEGLARERCWDLIRTNRNALDAVAAMLESEKKLSGDTCRAIIEANNF